MVTGKEIVFQKVSLIDMPNLGIVNTLAADEKYPVLNRDNLMIPVYMELSKKEKTFADFLATFFF